MNTDCEQIYAIPRWGEGYFGINAAGHFCVRPDPRRATEVDLVELARRLRDGGLSLPVLVRFNDILSHRVQALREAFAQAADTLDYRGAYQPVYPIKVNQQRSVVERIRDAGTGLEAGSKPELMAVLALAGPDALVICNGYKDREYIRLALIGRRLGLRLYIVIEKPAELALVLEEARSLGLEPLLGVRVRLAVEAAGNWQTSGGEKAKFGLDPGQLVALVGELARSGRLHWLRLLHAHQGSQIPHLGDIRNGLRELTRYYAELCRLGAPLELLDVGGGLGVDYEGTRTRDFCSINYNLESYAETVLGCVAEVCSQAGLAHPMIVTESGRAMTAHHALLITDVIDRQGDGDPPPPAGEADPREPLLQALSGNLERLPRHPPLETYETARELVREARAAFDAGRLALPLRARAEALFLATCHALRTRLDPGSRRQRELLERINVQLAVKLFCNLSIFQSMPDVWGIEQTFPVVPLQRLDEIPTERAVIHDLTCDSDGCIGRYVDRDGVEASLPVHAPAPGEYLLGFFLLGAYQEILGDMHNLFGDTDAVNLELDGNGGYRLLEPERGDSVDELLSYVHFDPRAMINGYRRRLEAAGLDRESRERLFVELKAGLFGNTYLEQG